MSGKLAKTRAKPKSGHFPSGNQKKSASSGLSPVMQNVQASLGKTNAAKKLAFFTDQPLSICQKLLSGHRLPNQEMLTALCKSPLVIETVLALTEGGTDPVVRDVHKAVRRLKLERELSELDGSGA